MPRTRKAPKATGPKFTEHFLPDAAGMFTFDAHHPFWANITSGAPNVEDCFVRLYPPAGLTPAQIATFKAVLMQKGGASAVKVMSQVVEAVADAPEPATAVPSRPIRQVVLERAIRTKGVRDQDALADLLTACMDKAGI